MSFVPEEREIVVDCEPVDPGAYTRLATALKVTNENAVNGQRTEHLPLGHSIADAGVGVNDDRTHHFAGGVGERVRRFLVVPLGARIVSWEAVVKQAGTTQSSAQLVEIDLTDGTAVALGSSQQAPASAGTHVLSETINHETEANKAYFVQFTAGQASDQLQNVDATWDFNTTVSAVDPLQKRDVLSAAELNELQDLAVDHESKLRGTLIYAIGMGLHRTDDTVSFPISPHSSLNYWLVSAPSQRVRALIPLQVGQRITAWTMFGNEGTSGNTTITGQLWKMDCSDGTRTQIGSDQTSLGVNGGDTFVGELGLDEFIEAGFVYFLEFTANGAHSSKRLYGWTLDVDRPASAP